MDMGKGGPQKGKYPSNTLLLVFNKCRTLLSGSMGMEYDLSQSQHQEAIHLLEPCVHLGKGLSLPALIALSCFARFPL